MGISKGWLGNTDVYVFYDFEDVMFRWAASEQKVFRKFVGDSHEHETEVPHSNKLFNDALRFGDEIDARKYQGGE
jgi:hypothetical protein